MLSRFDEPAVEAAFVTSERTDRLAATRLLAGSVLVVLVLNIGFIPLNFSVEGVVAYNAAAVPMVILLAVFVGTTFSSFYLTRPWIDIALLTSISVAMVFMIDALASQVAITGVSGEGMTIINLGIMAIFGSICVVAATRLFILWAVALLALCGALLAIGEGALETKVFSFINFLSFFAFACFVNWDLDRRARRTYSAKLELEKERAKTEQLLHNVLPEKVADRLRKGEVVADAFSDVAVVFVDIVGFSKLARILSPGRLVTMLNSVFGIADDCATRHGVEKVKTIGDAYLAVAGGTTSIGRDTQAAIAFARDLIGEVHAFAEQSRLTVNVRVGIHTGPVVGGVIGEQRMAYDYWGDTMNTAARLESVAYEGGIAVSESAYFSAGPEVAFEGPETITLKGIGDTQVYRVILDA